MNIKISKEVKNALENGGAVVALESTIISHGMPYPQNVETALMVEEEVRKNGAVPATIAIINGVPTIGCSKEEIEKLGRAGTSAIKVSRRDIPMVISRGLNGATTVAGTMIFASKAGIKVFATGGIGGVHRGAEKTMDISADLDELQRTNVCVVCAGAKSILDLNLTMEYLETKGVAVLGYRTSELPAFFTRKSGIKLHYRAEDAREIASALKVKEDMALGGGTLVVNPVPEEYSMDEKVINEAIEKALAEGEERGIKGKDITPFLLDKIQRLTGGDSLHSNVELVLNNARVASRIAAELAKLK